MRVLPLVASLLAVAAACDPGTEGRTFHGYVAVGAVQEVTYRDTCTSGNFGTLSVCSNDSVRELKSAAVSGPFEVTGTLTEADQGIARVWVRALDEGDGEVTAEVVLAGGKAETLTTTVRARHIRRVELALLCDGEFVGQPVPVLSGSAPQLRIEAYDATNRFLVLDDRPPPVRVAGGEVVPAALRVGLGEGEVRLTSDEDPSLDLRLPILDAAGATVSLEPVNEGTVRGTTNLRITAAVGAERVCAPPTGPWIVRVETQEVCALAPKEELHERLIETGTTTSAFGRKEGTCRLSLAHPTGPWTAVAEFPAMQ